MKTILLIIALTGLTGMSFAQNKNCCCKKTTAVRHKVVHRKYAVKTTAEKPMNEACYTYRKHNIVVTECPDVFFEDNDNGNIGYMQESNYLGYYPTESTPGITESVAPLSNHLIVTSTAFTDNDVIPAKYTCEGEHASPPLNVSNIPIGTKSLAIIVYDPYAGTPIRSKSDHQQNMTYWMAWNIDTTGNIPENYISDNQSINASNSWGYEAICPAAGTHYYHFAVYALDTKLKASKRSTKASLENDMRGHVLAEGEIVGLYNKRLE